LWPVERSKYPLWSDYDTGPSYAYGGRIPFLDASNSPVNWGIEWAHHYRTYWSRAALFGVNNSENAFSSFGELHITERVKTMYSETLRAFMYVLDRYERSGLPILLSGVAPGGSDALAITIRHLLNFTGGKEIWGIEAGQDFSLGYGDPYNNIVAFNFGDIDMHSTEFEVAFMSILIEEFYMHPIMHFAHFEMEGEWPGSFTLWPYGPEHDQWHANLRCWWSNWYHYR
jgi:hypothetical protein